MATVHPSRLTALAALAALLVPAAAVAQDARLPSSNSRPASGSGGDGRRPAVRAGETRVLRDGGGRDQQGGERGQRGQATRMHCRHSSERPKPPASEKPSADRLLQLLRGLEAWRTTADRDGLAGARGLQRAWLAPRHRERSEADERHGVAVLE